MMNSGTMAYIDLEMFMCLLSFKYVKGIPHNKHKSTQGSWMPSQCSSE